MLNKIERRIDTHNRSNLFNLLFMKDDLTYASKIISPLEIVRSRYFIVYFYQFTHFSSTIRILETSKTLPKNNLLLKLNPFIDGDLLRVGGRLVNAQLPHDSKHPLLLHRNDQFTRLLMNQTHADTFHGGILLTLGILRL